MGLTTRLPVDDDQALMDEFFATVVYDKYNDWRDTTETFDDPEEDDEEEGMPKPGGVLKVLRKGEEPGHEFHGNQWTGGMGAGEKPKSVSSSAQEKGIKAAVHELLSSGHPFTAGELHAILGTNPKSSSLVTAISDLKNPGIKQPYELLNIQKQPNGAYAHVGWKTGELEGVKAAHAAKKQDELKGKPVAAAKPEPLGDVKMMAPAVSIPAPAAVMSKAEADKVYEKATSTNNNKFMVTMAGISLDQKNAGIKSREAMLDWKQGRAVAMGQWKANTTGDAVTTVPQQLFQADINMTGSMIIGDVKFEEALGKWKLETNLEKQGLLEDGKKAAEVTLPNVGGGGLDPALGVRVNIPKDPDHTHISAKDFAGAHPEFVAGITSLKTTLSTGTGNSSDTIKMKLCADLAERLKNDKDFQACKKAYEKDEYPHTNGNPNSYESRLVRTWAGSSGDSNELSVSLQLAARDTFGMKPTDVETSNLKILQTKGELSVLEFARPNKGVTTQEFKNGLHAFHKAQYQSTQAYLKSQGIDHLYLARGMKFGDGQSKAEKQNLRLQPASSFSASYNTAHSFASNHSVYMVKVQASQILSTYRTGFGCASEHEVVVLAHKDLTSVKVGAGVGTNVHSAAFSASQNKSIK